MRNDSKEPLTLGEDAFFSTRVQLAPEVNAPMVFVGYGLSIPEKSYDDYAGLDLKGKVVVLISGYPVDIPSALASHYQSTAERYKTLRKAGVVRIVTSSFQNAPFTPAPLLKSTLATVMDATASTRQFRLGESRS